MKNTDTEINTDLPLLKEAFESASDPVFILVQQTIALTNNALEKLLGWKKEELVGKNFTEFTLDSNPMKNYVKGLSRQKTEDIYSARLKGKYGPVEVKICSTKIYIKGRYGRFVILK